MHSTSRVTSDSPKGDKGGNEFKIETNLKAVKDLHTFWDKGCNKLKDIKTPLNDFGWKYVQSKADEFTSNYPREFFKNRLKITSVT